MLARSHDGDRALRRSAYARTWRLAGGSSATPRRRTSTCSRSTATCRTASRYDEDPAAVPPGRATLDAFLFDTRSGYCQHFSGAMALLLRMGGIPARVVTGFSPGGYSKSKRAWIVRDTDAHSWVEAWFDEWGWVTFDPTPAGTPARSQIAALERAPETSSDRGDAASGDAGSAARTGGVRPDLLGPQAGPGGGGAAVASGRAGTAWWWFALGRAARCSRSPAWRLLRWRRRSLGPAAALDRAVAELEAALRRAGRPAAAGTTLQQLEQRLGRHAAGGGVPARAARRPLRADRSGPDGRRPPRAAPRAGERPRAAGRLRALWALPPWRASGGVRRRRPA